MEKTTFSAVDKKILVIGDAMLDHYQFGNVNRISPEAPVPVFLKSGIERYTPGGAANVAVNIAAIDMQVELCAVVGGDDNGRQLMDLLRSKQVGVEAVTVLGDRMTTSKLRYIGQNNQQVLRVDNEDVSDISAECVEQILHNVEECVNEYSLFLISDYQKGLLTMDLTQGIIDVACKNNIPVLVDVKDPNYKKYERATVLKPNRKELAMLSGYPVERSEEAVLAAVHLCQAANVSYVLATLGADGMILVDKNGLIHEAKSTASEVFDVTGAGDTSIAYLAASMVQGKSIEEAMVISNYAAGVQVSKVGTSVVYPDEVYAAMQKKGSGRNAKVLDYYVAEGLTVLKRLHEQGKKIIFTNGCFDVLHAGHVNYLQEAKSLGDILVVGVNSDASVRRLKGESRPVNILEDRMQVLSALGFVDYVIPFEEDTPARLIEEVIPDILVKGGDYKAEDVVGRDTVVAGGGEVVILPFVEGRSSTAIINRLKEKG